MLKPDLVPASVPAVAAPATLIVVRHGQTIWNAQGRWQGWLDAPLTKLGHEQARQAALALRQAGTEIDAAYSSDSGRAMQTAQIIVEALGQPDTPIHGTPALRERHYGSYEGLSTPEISARFPRTRYDELTGVTRLKWRPPGTGAESLHDVRGRVEPFLGEIAAKHPSQTILVVTHSNILRLLDSLATGEDLDAIWRHRIPPNACRFTLQAWPTGKLAVVEHFCTKPYRR